MLKGDIIEKISATVPDVLKKDIAQSVDIIIDTMNKALANGRRVEIRGFGSFSIRKRQPKVTKNPKTGAEMDIPQRNTMHFTMSKSLKYPLIDSSNTDETP